MREARLEERVPWTAIGNLAKLQARLAAEVAQLEDSQQADGEVTADDLRAGLLALPDELVPVAAKAIADRVRR